MDPFVSQSTADLADATMTLPGGVSEPGSAIRGESRWSDGGLPSSAEVPYSSLRSGAVLGGRYEIVAALGEGGMGAVYQARDREVDRFVALKVIRPDLAGNLEILRRFRRELVVARQITHPNVVRIFDLGVISGLRFITMEFIEGGQLSSILDAKGKLPAKEAAGIILQVCRGVAAAHSAGVVHRDLKPANIMIDAEGRVVVMDFGIARADAGTVTNADEAGVVHPDIGATQLGAVIGTPVYMSPEQAKGERVDFRSDLFAIGIIAYELLTGNPPFRGKTLKETIRKRCEEQAPPMEGNPPVPKALQDIVFRCLATRPDDRYQSAAEVVRALEIFLGIAPRSRRWKWIVGSVAASVVISSAFVTADRLALRKPAPHAPVKILIADLQNKTPDPVFNGAVEPMLSIAMEGAPFITSYNRTDAHRIGAQLRPQATGLDPSVARLVALREGIDAVISGSIELAGGQYRIALQALDSAKGTTIKSVEATVGAKDQVLASVGKLAASLRSALGDATPEAAKAAAAETFSSASLAAAQKYAQAQDLQYRGKWEDAVRVYGETAKLDPSFGRAYAGMAANLANMGRRQEAQKDYEIALTMLGRMSDREKYRTRGGYFLLMRKDQQALEQYKALVSAYPADTAGISNLAFVYFDERDMAAALREGRRAVALYPNNIPQRNNVGLFAMYAGDFATAIQESREILKMDPKFSKALLCIALSQLGQGNQEEAATTWGQLAALGPAGASAAAMGLADLELYQGRFHDVIAMLPKAVAVDIAGHNPSEAALKDVDLAEAYLAIGSKSQALKAAQAALSQRSDEMVAYPAAQIFIEAGEERKAAEIASKLREIFDPEPRAYAGLIGGLIKLRTKQYSDAVSAMQEAQKISDTWLGRLDLGRVYVEAGAFAEAETELDNCVKRLGEASAVFQDDEPSFRYLPAVYYYRGRAREGLHDPAAADDYKTFLGFKSKSEADPLVTDARSRLSKL